MDYSVTASTKNEFGDEVDKSEFDPVSRPRHYNREGAMECIDEMELVFGPEATANFCLLNCWKYRYRAGLKDNGYQDLEKSDWYMQKYKELKEKTDPLKTITIPSNPIDVTPFTYPTYPYTNPPIVTCNASKNIKPPEVHY